MNAGRTVFAQLFDLLSRRAFDLAVERHRGDRKVRRFSCMDQLLCMAFAQLTGRSSLRETVGCLRAIGPRRYHCGIRATPARSTLAEANDRRDDRIFMDTAMSLIAAARLELPVDPDLRRLRPRAFAIDSTTIDLCLALFPWALFRTFLTNHAALDAETVALLYRKRWQIELLFKWMKQHLHIKAFSAPRRTRSRRGCGSR